MESGNSQNRRSPGMMFASTLLGSLLGCASTSEITEIAKGTLVVDVRTPSEFSGWHYPGAKNIPVGELPARLDELGGKGGPIVVYCRSGNRSSRAKKILMDAGFSDVKNGGGLKEMKRLDSAR